MINDALIKILAVTDYFWTMLNSCSMGVNVKLQDKIQGIGFLIYLCK